jgi:molybdate transport system permease protein
VWAFVNDADLTALWLSFKVAACATLLALPLALGLAWLLARKSFWGKAALEIGIQLPMVLPPVVPGYVLLLLLGNQGLLGKPLAALGFEVAFTWKGAVLAALVMALPLMVQAMRLGFSHIDPHIEESAATLGARPWQIFWRISLRLAAPHLVAGVLLGFCRSLGEFGATMAFVGNIEGETRTLALAIYSYSHQPDGDGGALRLLGLSVGLSVLVLVGCRALSKRAQAFLH